MKNTTFLIFMALLLVHPTAKAVIIDGINYKLISEAKGAEVISNSEVYAGDVVVPSSVTYDGVEYRVTSIGESAFWGSYVTSINIPSTVTSMKENAFRECYYLASVKISDLAAWCSIKFAGFYSNPLSRSTRLYLNDEEIKELVIPEGVASIGRNAFYGCTGFTSVTIPNGVTSIGESAFSGCTGLTSVNISDLAAWCEIQFLGNESNPLSYAHKLYLNDEEITELTIPDDVTMIGNNAFCGCTNLTFLTIPDNITAIGNAAFYGCTGLTSVTIPGSVTSIGGSAFYNCTGLTTITIPSSVTSIGELAFYDCSSLSCVNISDLAAWCEIQFEDYSSNPLSLAHKLYLNDEEIKELAIPDGVAGIRNYAFWNCTGLTSVSIPNTTTSLGNYAFYGCTGLTSFTIPNSVTSLGKGVFWNCTSLTSVTIPNSVTSLGESVFDSCTSLTSVTIPNTMTSLGEYVFSSCTSLTSVTISNSVTEIKRKAFEHCSSLATIIIGGAISSISSQAFAYCPNLTDVYCHAESVPSTYYSVFEGSYTEYATLHVPASAIHDYQTNSPWSSFGSIVALDEDTPETPKCATPTISYQNGELTFRSETEGVDFVSEITDTDIRKNYEAKVSLTATYNISVYATKAGYKDSDVAYATLCWIEAEPKTEGIETDLAQIPVRPVMIQMRDGMITVTGAEDGQQISVYGMDGQNLGQGICKNGTADISTSLRRGSTAIVRIGEKAVKVVSQ